jgi:hypothetical protein
VTLLADPVAIVSRRRIAAGALAPLAESISRDQERVLAAPIEVPRAKALLSRAGGSCELDGTPLEFDPWSPHAHRCPSCGRVHRGELHDRWWLYPYQLWLAERGVHSAVLFALDGDVRHARFTHDLLHQYCDAYLQYPNRDNVLGPARPFFSTYLDSIWLLQVCVALDLLEATGDAGIGAVVRERVLEPAAALIAQYDEGLSNRQVWNNAALLAANTLLDRPRETERVAYGPSGILTHLEQGLLDDATWYEGENYHQFAHRGLWYCVTIAERAGITLPRAAVARFDAGFAATFATALPDLTLPSRKDSHYGTSLRQWRFAEAFELGLARHDDERLAEALGRLYDGAAPVGDTGRSRSSAEAERNAPPVRLTRADLGWKSLLVALEELPEARDGVWRSALMEGQGIAVMRRDAGATYVALDYGQSGGGHGHPDRLNVLFATGSSRWLDDMGTASYVDRSLHWFRSTLAHNAPLVSGRSQLPVDGSLDAFDDRGGAGWVRARAEIADGVEVCRALIVMPQYFIDEVQWTADGDVQFMLPIHLDAPPPPHVTLAPARFPAGDGPEDGGEFVGRASAFRVPAGSTTALSASGEDSQARAFVMSDCATVWYTMAGPGQPPSTERSFFVLEQRGSSGTIRCVWAWTPDVANVEWTAEGVIVHYVTGERHHHVATERGWQIELHAGQAHSTIDLGGLRAPPTARRSLTPDPRAPLPASLFPVPSVFELGEPHYRRSEDSWEEAGRPTARVAIGVSGRSLIVDISVASTRPCFMSATAGNPYDNEPADINGDGVQLYFQIGQEGGAWLLVPEPPSANLRVREISGWGDLPLARGEWHEEPHGYAVHAEIPLPHDRGAATEVGLDLLINETVSGRDRRRGQLVLSGARGEWVYLRGDRHDPARLLRFIIQP